MSKIINIPLHMGLLRVSECSCLWFTFQADTSGSKNRHRESVTLCRVCHTLQQMLRDTDNWCGESPKCHFFSKLRQKAGLVVMKLKIWIKWFIISLIYIQDISQKFPVLKMFSIWRTDSTRMDFHSPSPPRTTHCFLFLTSPPAHSTVPRHHKGCLIQMRAVCMVSSVIRALWWGCWASGELVWWKRDRSLPPSLVPRPLIDDRGSTGRGIWRVKQINLNAIQLFQSQ